VEYLKSKRNVDMKVPTNCLKKDKNQPTNLQSSSLNRRKMKSQPDLSLTITGSVYNT